MLENVDLSGTNLNNSFTFNGSDSAKSSATAVAFFLSPSTKFIPSQIIEEFPNLNGLVVAKTNIPVLRQSFLTEKFKKLQHVNMGRNNMERIELRALVELVNLEWIFLGYNKLESLKERIFEANTKLQYISFYENHLKIVNPHLFKDLMRLRYLDLELNPCMNQNFVSTFDGCYKSYHNWPYCKEFQVQLEEIDGALSVCHKNCRLDHECSNL